LIRHLPAADVDVYGLVVGTSQVGIFSGGRVTAFALPKDPLIKRLFRGRQAALRQLHEQPIDLIAAHFALYALPVVDRLRAVPTVVHFHGPWAAETGVEGASSLASRVQAALERSVYSRARRLIVLSQSFQQELVRRYRIPEDLVRVVPGGIDSDRFNVNLSRMEARERLGWPTDRPIVLSVRRQMRRMGLENLIDASRELVKTHPDLLVLLAGSGPIADDLARRISEYGLENNVRQLGRVDDDDLPVAYRAADFTVVPSQSLEGFGMITLESLASGTPVFVTPIGGLPEVIEPFAPQCVFDGVRTRDIQIGLGEALRGDRILPTSEVCRDYAASRFAWPVIAKQTRAVYEEALS
jgi:glycogen(starch) synthase